MQEGRPIEQGEGSLRNAPPRRGRGLLHELHLMLCKVFWSHTKFEKGLEKTWLDYQDKWGCVCGGGEEE